jgi:anti-sigma factor RsiW
MTLKCEEAQELIADLIDDELSPPERAAVEEHFEGCSGCRFVYHSQLALKSAVHETGAGIKAPAALRERILHDPRVFRPKPGAFESPRTSKYLRPALAAGLLVLLTLPTLYLMRRPEAKPLSMRALEIHEKIIDGELSFVRGGSAEEIKETLSRSAAGAFAPMTYDLTALKLKAVGGAVRDFDGRKVLVTVYQGNGLTVTCYTFLGTESDAPSSAERVYDSVKKINFYIYSQGRIHAVLHREGKLICILASSLPAPGLLDIARSGA